MEVDQRAPALLCDSAQGAFQGGVALARSRSENVTHQAMGVHPHQHRNFAVLDVPSHQSYMRLATVDFALIGNQAEFAEARVHQRLAHAMHVPFMGHAIANEFGDSKHLQTMLAPEFDQVGNTSQPSVTLHDTSDLPL